MISFDNFTSMEQFHEAMEEARLNEATLKDQGIELIRGFNAAVRGSRTDFTKAFGDLTGASKMTADAVWKQYSDTATNADYKRGMVIDFDYVRKMPTNRSATVSAATRATASTATRAATPFKMPASLSPLEKQALVLMSAFASYAQAKFCETANQELGLDFSTGLKLWKKYSAKVANNPNYKSSMKIDMAYANSLGVFSGVQIPAVKPAPAPAAKPAPAPAPKAAPVASAKPKGFWVIRTRSANNIFVKAPGPGGGLITDTVKNAQLCATEKEARDYVNAANEGKWGLYTGWYAQFWTLQELGIKG